jgi:hypothetical protein
MFEVDFEFEFGFEFRIGFDSGSRLAGLAFT